MLKRYKLIVKITAINGAMTAVPCYNSSIVLTTATTVSALTAAAVQTFWFCSFYLGARRGRSRAGAAVAA